MKIVHIINNLNRGGAETLLLHFIPEVEKELGATQTTVIILENRTALLEQFTAAGIDVILVDTEGLSDWKKIRKVAKELKKINPDIVHTHLLFADKVGQIAAFLAGVRTRVSSLHNMEIPTTLKARMGMRIVALLATRVVAVSNSVKSFYVDAKLYAARKFKIIYNAPSFISSERVSTGGPSLGNEPIRFIAVGRLHPQKGYPTLIDAMKILKDRGYAVDLKIWGKGPEQESLQDQIDRQELSSNVQLCGTTNSIGDEFLKAHYFVNASQWEGFNMGLVEALSVGLPVVATKLPPHCEILEEHSSYPYLVEPNSPDALADAIDAILKVDYSEVSENALATAERFSRDQLVHNYVALYRDLGR